jgi:glycosyltransferase involved in cell wall biosynthesis
MCAAAGNPEWRNERRAKSLERAREFSWTRTAELTYDVYEEALKRF